MLNLNMGNNWKLLESCRTLKEYMQYVERVRSYARKPDMTLETAVDECIKENILADFLRRNRAEAIYMSIFEYDEEKELALIREDEYNAGVKAGKKEGIKEGIKEGREGAAVRMLAAGTYSLEEIASISGLSVETVGMLKAAEKQSGNRKSRK